MFCADQAQPWWESLGLHSRAVGSYTDFYTPPGNRVLPLIYHFGREGDSNGLCLSYPTLVALTPLIRAPLWEGCLFQSRSVSTSQSKQPVAGFEVLLCLPRCKFSATIPMGWQTACFSVLPRNWTAWSQYPTELLSPGLGIFLFLL